VSGDCDRGHTQVTGRVSSGNRDRDGGRGYRNAGSTENGTDLRGRGPGRAGRDGRMRGRTGRAGSGRADGPVLGLSVK